MSEKTFHDRLRSVRLFERYGAALTQKQREACSAVFLDDLSLSETAELLGVTRQGVHDLVHRALLHMEGLENKLMFIKKLDSLILTLDDLARHHGLPQGFTDEMKLVLEEV